MNKRGNAILDGALIVAVIVALVTVVFITHNINSKINTELQADPNLPQISKDISANSTALYPSYWDGVIVFVLVVLWALALITAHRIDSEPFYFVFTFFGIILVVISALSLQAYYEDLVEDPEFSTFPAEFPMTNWIMSKLGIIILFIAISVGVVLHSKL